MKEVVKYECDKCGKAYSLERDAIECEFKHKRAELANKLLEDGFTLKLINYICGFGWDLSEEMEEVTKENCFKISYWECCEKPAYRITHIQEDGKVYLFGIGGWNGGYGGNYDVSKLKNPRPADELFVYNKI